MATAMQTKMSIGGESHRTNRRTPATGAEALPPGNAGSGTP